MSEYRKLIEKADSNPLAVNGLSNVVAAVEQWRGIPTKIIHFECYKSATKTFRSRLLVPKSFYCSLKVKIPSYHSKFDNIHYVLN